MVRECGLRPTGVVESVGVHAREFVNTYLIDVYLPNLVVARGVQVNEAESLPGPDNVLIGMDILNLGDFAVSNYRGKTTFTFRTPSLKEIDFSPPTPKVGRMPHARAAAARSTRSATGLLQPEQIATESRTTAPAPARSNLTRFPEGCGSLP